MIYMDRVNSVAPKWSHVMSDTNSVEELEAFRRRVGAPPSALQLPPKASRPHLDIYGGPKRRALELADRVFPNTMAMVRWERAGRPADVSEARAG